MSFDFDCDKPIYLQIVQNIKNKIISGKLKNGEKILSVRELAVYYGVNPNTIMKALAELENLNLIYTERTNGKFVTEDLKLIEKIKIDVLNKKFQVFIEDIKQYGLLNEEILTHIKNNLKEK